MAGAGQAFDVMKGLEELKVMRQTHEENAKMSAAKNKLLESEAKQKELLAWHDNEMAAVKLDRAKAEAGAATKEAEGRSQTAPLKTKNEVFSLDTESLLAPAARSIATQNQAGLAKATPFAIDALVNDAMLKSGASREAVRLQPTRQAIESVGVASQEDNMFEAARTAKIAARTARITAENALKQSEYEAASGISNASAMAAAKLKLVNAEIEEKLADAGLKKAQANPDVMAAKQRASDEKALVDQYLNFSTIQARLASVPIYDVVSQSPSTVSQIVNRYFQYGPNGEEVARDQAGWGKNEEYLDPGQIEAVSQYRNAMRLTTNAMNRVGKNGGANAASRVDNTNVPVYGMRPDGTYGIINKPATIVIQ
jgi:hypothetical protein